ncbi:glycinol 4-dimethylallyltransferase-like isoform X1 [Cajanus cajan]|uniref:glycinol 4-dimethylallyltransferase-like isoform X1 n=1 Tax=Cajanus cajan TaxID=3821 RepID=UPI0010FBA140|nr:glycinol 4-dimethylallyltransferase-like isoform X1 [Cajanus cajan]
MDSAFLKCFPNASSLTTGGNLLRSKYSTKNIYFTNSYASKVSEHRRKTQQYNFWRVEQPTLNHHYKCIEGGSTNKECNRKYVVKGIPGPSSNFEPHAFDPKNIFDSVKYFLITFYKFSIPHASFTRILSTISASFLVVEKLSDISPLFFIGLLQAMIPFSFVEIYVNSLNQLFDIEIDKINKPYLPLASGEISFTTGIIVVASCLTLSIYFGWIIGSWPLIWGILICLFLWTAYSINVPLLRWKKHPLLAAMCMFVTWGFIFPTSIFFHMQTFVFKKPTIFPRSLIFNMVFVSIFFVGMALCKDIPDIEGDKAFGIYSLPARIGPKRVFWISVSLFETAFGVALLMGATSSSSLWIKIVTGLGHSVLASILWYKAKSVDLRCNASIASFYLFIWKLLSVEYFFIPLIR